MSTRYRSNSPRFVDETIDGEALIMDMVKGSYYSCVGTSAVAWNALTAGASVADIAAALISQYGLSESDAVRDVEEFVAAVVADEMVVPSDAALEPPVRALELSGVPAEYTKLEFERFTDLADLILLDPVHDVTEAGWPHAAS